MIGFESVTFTYPGAPEPTLRDVDLEIPDGELFLVVGSTGRGKTTLLRAVNGLVPHFTGGELRGRVLVDTLATTAPPREFASVVGAVGQHPASGFVTDRVEDELAYVMENLGVPPATMRRRVEDTLDLLGITALRGRSLATLSSGEAQRVAIGSVLTAGPRTLVLDEPTSALDPAAAEDVLAILLRLVDDLGLTVLIAEHRLERVAQYATGAAHIDTDGRLRAGAAAEILAGSELAPPVVRLGRSLGWNPTPVSVREARRRAGDLRDRLAHRAPPVGRAPNPGAELLRLDGVALRYGNREVLRSVDLSVREGEIVALMGRNGSGKSTLLATIAGMRSPASGAIAVLGTDPQRAEPAQRIRRVALVPSDPSWLLYERTVATECATADREHELAAGTTRTLLDRIAPGVSGEQHPRDLSEGQRLALALAVVCAPGPSLILLDEPTRGLDLPAKTRLVETLRGLAGTGCAVICATHDVELVAELAHRAVVLADREVVADGPARDVVCHSPVFAPQIAKVVAPLPWLTVDEVLAATA